MHNLYALMSSCTAKKGQALTDRVHGMRRQLEYAIKDKRAALKEAVTPIPAIIGDYAVCF
jgi:hypothetical protein